MQTKFIGGEIKEGYRGDLALIILQEGNLSRYNVFLYPVGSDEYIFYTGVATVQHPLLRAYVGINPAGVCKIMEKAVELNMDRGKLRNLDELVIYSNFF